MPVKRIVVDGHVIEPADAQEALAVVSWFAPVEQRKLREKWTQELANLIRGLDGEKVSKRWQELWRVATKCFSAGRRGYPVDTTLKIANVIAKELNLAGFRRLEELARGAWELGVKYSGKRPKQRKGATLR